MKKKHLLGVVLIFLCIVAIGYLPIKVAVKEENLNHEDSYILVQEHEVTAISTWFAIGDNTTMYETLKSVELRGNVPPSFGVAIDFAQNTFICYGEFTGTGDFYGEEYAIFEVEEWNIVYPVQRAAIVPFLWPEFYLCLYDLW